MTGAAHRDAITDKLHQMLASLSVIAFQSMQLFDFAILLFLP